MEIEINDGAFDELQNYLVGEIVSSVYRGLGELKLPRNKLEDIVNTIAFNVCCAIDGSTVMEHGGKRVLPVLTFATSPDFKHVLSNGCTSFMHEYVHGTAEQVLDEQA